MSFFSSLSKIIQGDTRVRTRDLSVCSRMLYHWAMSPLHTDSITSLQTRACCLSTVTMFFVPSQVYSRDRCHFSLVFQNLYKGTPGFKPGTSQTAAECSTTELYPRCKQIPKHHCKHVQVVWALLQNILFRVKCTLAIDVIFLQSFKNYTRGHPGSVQGPLGLQLIALPLSYVSAAYRFNSITANTLRLFEHWYQVFCSESSVLSRSMSFFSSLSKIIQRGHPFSNQGPLGLQPNALPLSYILAANRFQNITANTCRSFEHCYKVVCSESSVLSRSMSFFSSLSIIIQGGSRVRSRVLSDCVRMLYHWAISPLRTDSKLSLQTCAAGSNSETIFGLRSQMVFATLLLIFVNVFRIT